MTAFDLYYRIDQIAHILHQLHLIPGRLARYICDHFERFLGA